MSLRDPSTTASASCCAPRHGLPPVSRCAPPASRSALARTLKRGDKALIGNTGYRRYLKTIRDEHFAIDPDKVGVEGSSPFARSRFSWYLNYF